MLSILNEVLIKKGATFSFLHGDLVIIWKGRNYVFNKGTWDFNFMYSEDKGITSAKNVVTKWMKEALEAAKKEQMYLKKTYNMYDGETIEVHGDPIAEFTANKIKINDTWVEKQNIKSYDVVYMNGKTSHTETGNRGEFNDTRRTKFNQR